MATVESSDMEVMVEFGVPGMSEGVTGSDGGGGRLINVGALDIATGLRVFVLVRKVSGIARSSSSAVRASESR